MSDFTTNHLILWESSSRREMCLRKSRWFSQSAPKLEFLGHFNVSCMCVFLICTPPGPPVIVIPPRNISVNMSRNAMLRCHAVADPPNMTYIWQKDGENVYHVEWVDLFPFATKYFSHLPLNQNLHPSGSDNHWGLNSNISNTVLQAKLETLTSLFPQ